MIPEASVELNNNGTGTAFLTVATGSLKITDKSVYNKLMYECMEA